MSKAISEELAAEAKQLTFEELPPEVVHQVKRSVMDNLGNAIGGYESEPSRIMQSVIADLRGPPESTVIGSGVKTSCLYAALANGIMARYLDYMDRTFLSKEARVTMGHHGESVVPTLAVAERQHVSGREAITSIALAYELSIRLMDSVGGTLGVMAKRGWTPETIVAPCIMGLVAGRLLGLNEEQMAHALALAGGFTLEPGVMHSGEEEIPMARNLRYPYGAYSGIFGALTAQKGFKGALRIFEGHNGLAQVVTGGEMNLERLRQPSKEWAILNTWIKNFSTEGRMHGHIEGTLTLIHEHDIKPEDVVEVRIKTNVHTHRKMGNPETRRFPKTKFTADHSSYYTTAIAIVDRTLGPEQFAEHKLHDSRVQALLGKIFVDPDPRLDPYASGGTVEIITTKGKKYYLEVLEPKGHPMNPMTDADIERKFRSLACKLMDEKQMSEVIALIYDLENISDIGELMRLAVVKQKV